MSDKNYYSLLKIDPNKYFIDHIYQSDDYLQIYIIKKKEKFYVCNKCGSTHIVTHSYKNKSFKHSIFNYQKASIHIKQRMFKCKDCNSFFLEQIDYGHYIQNLTDQTILYILDELRKKQSFKEIALRSNVSSQTVINIFEKYIDCPRGKLPEYICIDEFCYEHKKEGNKYACIIIDFLTSEIIDIIPSRRHSFLLPYINNHYSNSDKLGVKYVISDMYEGYEYLSKNQFLNSQFVVDSFHYVRYVIDAFNFVRIRIQKNYTTNSIQYYILKKYAKTLSKFYKELSSPNIYFFNKKLNRDISLDEIIDMALSIDFELRQAYYLKEQFLRKFNYTTKFDSEKFVNWCIREFSVSTIPEFEKLSNLFSRWKNGIINSFIKVNNRRLSNGPIEGTNNTVKSIIKISYGYSNFLHLRNRIMYIVNKKKSYITNSPNKFKNIYKKRK